MVNEALHGTCASVLFYAWAVASACTSTCLAFISSQHVFDPLALCCMHVHVGHVRCTCAYMYACLLCVFVQHSVYSERGLFISQNMNPAEI